VLRYEGAKGRAALDPSSLHSSHGRHAVCLAFTGVLSACYRSIGSGSVVARWVEGLVVYPW
jgi:hypothetical protein